MSNLPICCSWDLPGLISSRIFLTDGHLEKSARTPLMKCILNWVLMCVVEEEDLTMERCSAFLAEISKCISSKSVVALKPDWLPSATEVGLRFEKAFVEVATSQAKETWHGAGGADEVASMFDNCNFIPAPLQSVLQLAKNVAMLEGLKPVEPKFEDLQKDLQSLVKPVKKWMVTLSINMNQLGDFLSQEKINELRAFSDSVLKALGDLLIVTGNRQKSIVKIVGKFRPAAGHVEEILNIIYVNVFQIWLFGVAKLSG